MEVPSDKEIRKIIEDRKMTIQESEKLRKKVEAKYLETMNGVKVVVTKPQLARLELMVRPEWLVTPTNDNKVRITFVKDIPTAFDNSVFIIVVNRVYNSPKIKDGGARKWERVEEGVYEIALDKDWPALHPGEGPINPADPWWDNGLPIFVVVGTGDKRRWGYIHLPIYEGNKK